MIEGGRRARGISDGDEFEGTELGVFFHTDQHSQSGIDILELRMMEGGKRAGGVSDGNKFKGARPGVSFYADQYG